MRYLLRIPVAAGAALISPALHADNYPSKPITLVAVFGPGSASDTICRVIAQPLSVALKESVIVENRPGANGALAAMYVARAAPDGYTLLMGTNSPLSAVPFMMKNPSYDAVRDFTPITRMGSFTLMLVVHPSIPAKNVKELIAYAKANPGKLNYASGGSGTSSHLLMEMFNLRGGISMVQVPYKGTGPALIDQVSGLIEVAFSTAVAALPYVQSGRLRVLAVSTRERLPTLPEVPTIAESGLSGFDGGSWQGVVMPAGAPRDIVDAVNGALVRTLNAPGAKAKILAMGGIVARDTPGQFAAFMKSETEKWAQVVKAAHVKIE